MGYGNLSVGNVVIQDVALVEGLKHNLLSVSQFTDKGFKVDFDRDDCLVSYRNTGELAFKCVRKGSLFVVDLNNANKDKIYCFY